MAKKLRQPEKGTLAINLGWREWLIVIVFCAYWTFTFFFREVLRSCWSTFHNSYGVLLLCFDVQVLSRLGHMSYDVIGQQILQTGIPSSKANLIGTTEVSVASLAEFVMLGIAIIANDVSHFGYLAMLSLLSVIAAAYIFCLWLMNPTEEQRKLFSFQRQFWFHSEYSTCISPSDT